MDDTELNAIRAARLAEIQRNAGQGPATSLQAQPGPATGVLSQVLEASARERLSRVRIVRPDRADAVEQYIVKLVQMGQVSRKLSEEDVVEILDGLSRDEKKQAQTKIVFNRREDDDDDDFFD